MVSKPSLKQVHKKWMLEAPEIMKKQKNKKQKTKQRLAHLKICIELQKSHWGLDDYLFLDECPKYAFVFSCLIEKNIVWGLKRLLRTRW